MLTIAITNKIKVLCSFAIGLMYSENSTSYVKRSLKRSFYERLNTCYDIGAKASERGLEVPLAIAIAFHESRFSYSPSDKGAKGPLGVLPKYHCENVRDCDLVEAGLNALEKFSEINSDVCTTLAQYNAGLNGGCEKGDVGRGYAKQVLLLYSMYEIIYTKTEVDGENNGTNSSKSSKDDKGRRRQQKP